jgi:SRSO17 transposase
VEPRRQARAYLTGLLAPVERKNGWQLAEAAGDATPDKMQRLLNAAWWDPDEVRDDLRAYVVENLGDPDGVLIVDGTGFVKQGTRSVGVQRKYSGTAGRVENCQLAVFCAYATARGRALIDRELYLPKSWTDDRSRMDDAGVPDDYEFATKPVLATRMLGRALDAGTPASWVTADEAYGHDSKFRRFPGQRAIGYVVAVPGSQSVHTGSGSVRTDTLVAGAPEQAWKRLSTGEGSKGQRLHDWAMAALPGHEHRLDKSRCLDHYQVRRYHGWYRHITLSMLAYAYLAVTAATDPKAAATWSASAQQRSAVSWYT